MPMSSLIVGVDLAPVHRRCTTFVDDITTQSCRAQLKRCTPDGVQYDVVIHDGAPNVGGNFAAESYTQALTLDSLRLATEFLKEGGWFVTKVFRSTEYHALLYSMQQLFQKVESTKPVASRGTSAEIYVVCQGFLAPRKVDARLLDPRHLFAEYEGPKQAVDVLSHAKRPRNRSGYEDGVSALYKECPAETFVLCDKPAELLGQYHAFLLDASVRVPETKNAVFWFFFVNAFAARLEADDDQPFSQFVRRNRRVKKHFASFNEASNARVVRDATRRSNARLDSFFDTLFLPCRNSGKKNKKKRRTRRAWSLPRTGSWTWTATPPRRPRSARFARTWACSGAWTSRTSSSGAWRCASRAGSTASAAPPARRRRGGGGGRSNLNPRREKPRDLSDSDEKILEEMAEHSRAGRARAPGQEEQGEVARQGTRAHGAWAAGQDEEGAMGASGWTCFRWRGSRAKAVCARCRPRPRPAWTPRATRRRLGDAERRGRARALRRLFRGGRGRRD